MGTIFLDAQGLISWPELKLLTFSGWHFKATYTRVTGVNLNARCFLTFKQS
jgi:hypothetical protein